MKRALSCLVIAAAAIVLPAHAAAATPRSCLVALTAGEDIAHILGIFTTAVSDHISALDKAERGIHFRADVDRTIRVLGDRAGTLNGRLRRAVQRYDTASAACRAG